MKKVLIASTALVAATMFSGAASASEKIKLELGGYSKWWVVGQWQDDKFQANANTAGAQGDYNNVDIKGDNEVYIGGSTTLDNGLKVGINVELEAGGNTGANGSDNSDLIDKSSVFVESGYGKVILGSEANGTALLHVYAPDAAGNNDSDGILTGGWAIVKPTNSAVTRFSTSIDTDDNAEKVTYVAPSFYGLTLGASYVPNAGNSEDTRASNRWNSASAAGTAQPSTGEIYGVGALYAKSFGPVDVKLSGGWVTYDVNAQAKSKVNEYSTGTQIAYGNFTIGGSYRQVNSPDTLANTVAASGNMWDAGIQYASGPYAISFIYVQSKEKSAQTAGDDTFTAYQVSGKYSLGAGVDALATIGHAEFEDASSLPQDENKGWAVMTGLSLAF